MQTTDIRFADIQMLRYEVKGFERLTLRQKTLIYHLQEAALWGRDILFDQNGRHNLRIRRTLEALYTAPGFQPDTPFGREIATYLRRVWFSSGIHHHYGCQKFCPGFTPDDLRRAILALPPEALPLRPGETAAMLCDELFPVIFDPEVMPMRVNQRSGDDLLLTSACNYYDPTVTQAEAEAYYNRCKRPGDAHPVMYGMNSRLERRPDGTLAEHTWRLGGMYSAAIAHIVSHLERALPYADTPAQRDVISRLVRIYHTGDLKEFDEYTIHWLRDTESLVDFTCYFTETYGDPLGHKASWEAYVNFEDLEATRRTRLLAERAQWFEDHSPVSPEFKKQEVRGVSAKVVNAAILAGDLYPSTAIGINLPNSDWVRAEHGSKSVTIGNLIDAYNRAAHGSGMLTEFVIDTETLRLIDRYGDLCDSLHTDLHECLGHGSGRLLPGTAPDALGPYASTIEEARADLFGLYYIADPELCRLGLTPDPEAYRSQYYEYLMNGLLTQLVRIRPGEQIEEAHMRNRALIARYALEQGGPRGVLSLERRDGKTCLRVSDYEALRQIFAGLLAEIQRIKSEGDLSAARHLVETYGVHVDPTLHAEVLSRYERLNLAPYKGFINPVYHAETDADGRITDVTVSYDEPYDSQMLRYSRDYSAL